MDDHTWASIECITAGDIDPRCRPEHCSLHILLDRMAQDIFPGRRVILDPAQSQLNDRTWLKFIEFDDLYTVKSTTWINMLKKAPEEEERPSMAVEQQLRSLSAWLQTCDSNTAEYEDQVHSQCHEGNDDLSIPAKRVLDLADAAADRVCIVETAGIEGRYNALSHCWGEKERHPLKTLHATLEDHMSGITLSSLPQSFKDAVQVCLYLGIRYIWIDCLCIVQVSFWLLQQKKHELIEVCHAGRWVG